MIKFGLEIRPILPGNLYYLDLLHDLSSVLETTHGGISKVVIESDAPFTDIGSNSLRIKFVFVDFYTNAGSFWNQNVAILVSDRLVYNLFKIDKWT